MTGTSKSTKTIAQTNNPLIDGVLTDVAWASTITYAFPTSSSSYSYSDSSEPYFGFRAVSAAQKDAALFTLEKSFGSSANDGFSVEGFTRMNFTSGSNSSATLRFGQSDEPATAHAWMPGAYDQGGDVWFGTTYEYRNPVAGNYAWSTMIHEIGHALGLKHGHEVDTFSGFPALPAEQDSLEYSIMTYRSHVGADPNAPSYEEYGAPQSFMMADIAALQEMYGGDYTTQSGDTVYSWKPSSGKTLVDGKTAISPGDNRIFATLWDGGGEDTFDLTAYKTAVKIDLRPGKYSAFSKEQLAFLGGGPNDGFARGNIFNALLHDGDVRSLIENAWGGSGNDTITGNQVANELRGNAGNDYLRGEGGNDVLVGGAGADKLDGGSGNDTASYGGAGKGVTAALSSPEANTNDAAGDRYISIENLTGTKYADKLYGDSKANILTGGSGNDMLKGLGGDDRLYGGAGADDLYGGSGADRFIFKAVSDSTLDAKGRDTIFDFSGKSGDRIDLSSIDANTKAGGNQAFKFIGTDEFSDTAGELRYRKTSSDTYIYGDVDGDGNRDFAIHLDDAITLQKGYFIL